MPSFNEMTFNNTQTTSKKSKALKTSSAMQKDEEEQKVTKKETKTLADNQNKVVDDYYKANPGNNKETWEAIDTAVGKVKDYKEKIDANDKTAQHHQEVLDKKRQEKVENLKNVDERIEGVKDFQNNINEYVNPDLANNDFFASAVQRTLDKLKQEKNDIDETLSGVYGLFKDGVRVSDEQATEVYTSSQRLSDIKSEKEQLTKQYNEGTINQDDYVNTSNALDEEAVGIAQSMQGYEFKQGWDYWEQVKDDGTQESKDLTKALSHYDDGIFERLANGTMATVNDFINSPMEAMAVSYTGATGKTDGNIHEVAQAGYDKTQQLRQYAYSGATPMEQMTTEVVTSLMPQMVATAGAIAMTYATGGASAGATLAEVAEKASTLSTFIMGLQGGISDSYEMINQGYTYDEAITHGAMVGTISFLVEKIGAESFTKTFMGPTGQWLLADSSIGNKLAYSAVIKTMGENALNEGIEEVVESLATNVGNEIYNAYYGVQLQEEQLMDTHLLDLSNIVANSKELGKEALYAGIGAMLMTGGSAIRVQINTNQEYKALTEACKRLENNIASCQDVEELKTFNDLLKSYQSAITDYKSNSELMNAVEEIVANEENQNIDTYNEAMNNLAEAYRFNIQNASQMQADIEDAMATMDSALARRGIKTSSSTAIGADENGNKIRVNEATMYLDADEASRKRMMELGQLYQNLGIDGRVGDETYDAEFKSKNASGYYLGDNGEVVANINSEKAVEGVIAHELTHSFEGSMQYDNLVNLIGEENLEATWNNDGNGEQRTNNYKNAYKNKTEQELNDILHSEKVTRYVQENLANKSFIKKVIQYDESVVYRMIRGLEAMLPGTQKTKIENAWMKAFNEVETQNKEEKIKHDLELKDGEVEKNLVKDGDKYRDKRLLKHYKTNEFGIKYLDVKELGNTELKDSVVKDESGNLIQMLHGTNSEDFSLFDPMSGKFGLFGLGSYFTNNFDVAEGYANKKRKNSGTSRIYYSYLNIKNPIDMDAEADMKLWNNYLYYADGKIKTNEDGFNAFKNYAMDEDLYQYDAEEELYNLFEENNYDGITHIGGGRFNDSNVRHRVYIAFNPEQIYTEMIQDLNQRKIVYDLEDEQSSFSLEEVKEKIPLIKRNSKEAFDLADKIDLETQHKKPEIGPMKFLNDDKGPYILTHDYMGDDKDHIQRINYVYRAVSPEELNFILKNGYIKSNQSMNIGYEVEQNLTDYAWNHSPSFYLPEDGGYILKVKTNPSMEFDKVDEYIKTSEPTPIQDIVEINGKKIKLDNFDENTKYSLEEDVDDVGYHYDNGGFDINKKSETLAQRQSKRYTGAFGTGNYFFGYQANYGGDRNQEHAVDFSNYNLFKPRNAEDGYKLHDFFRDIENYYDASLPRTLEDFKNEAQDYANKYDREKPSFNDVWDSYEFALLDDTNLEYDDFEKQYLENYYELTDEETEKLKEGLKKYFPQKTVDKIINSSLSKNDKVISYYVPIEVESMLERGESFAGRAEDQENIEKSLPKVANILGVESEYLRNIIDKEDEAVRKDFANNNLKTDTIGTRIMKDLGYDGIDVRGIKELDNSTYGSVIYDVNPSSVLYSLEDEDLHEQNVKKHGVQEKGENAVRDVEIAKATDKGKTARAVKHVAESQAVTDRFAEKMQRESDAGSFTYQDETLEDMRKRNEKQIIDDGYEKAVENFLKDVTLKRAKNVVVRGELLLQQALQKGHTEEAMRIAQKLVIDESLAGQAVVASRIFSTLSPELQLVTIEKQIKTIQESLDKEYKGKAPKITVDANLIEQLKNATTEEEKIRLFDEIGTNIAEQIPSSLADKVNAWRYLAMLGNPRTHIRNIIGNTTFAKVVDIKTMLATGMEKAYQSYAIKNGKEFQRKADVINMRNADDKALYDRAIQDYEGHKIEEHKFNLQEDIGKKKNVFNNNNPVGKALNYAVKKNAGLLSIEDTWAMSKRYAKALAGYLKSNNLNFDNATELQLYDARQYATNEALRATFNDSNKMAHWLSTARNAGNVPSFLIDALIPFKNTPLNIINRGVEYSPLGIAKGIAQLKNGEVSANEVIDSFASGMTGTGIVLLGALLRSLGLFRIKDDDKDRKKYFDQENGEQDYALVVDGNTYTIDWLDPIIVPLAMGASAYDGFVEQEIKSGIDIMDNIVDLALGVADPIFETTMLSSLTGAMSSYSKDAGGKILGFVESAVQSYVLQFIPTIFGQLARTVDDTRRTTSPNGGIIDETGKKILNKIPGASMLNEPYISTKTGEEKKTEDLGMGAVGRLLLNTISPGYYSSNKEDKYSDEAYRLYEQTGNLDAFPSSKVKSTTYDSETYKFTDKEYTQWNKTRYSIESDLVNKFIDSEDYQDLEDGDRAEIIGKIRDYAGLVAKKQLVEARGETFDNKQATQLRNIENALDNGLDISEYYQYKGVEGKKNDKVEALANSGLTNKEKEYVYSEVYGYKGTYQDAYNSVFGKKK